MKLNIKFLRIITSFAQCLFTSMVYIDALISIHFQFAPRLRDQKPLVQNNIIINDNQFFSHLILAPLSNISLPNVNKPGCLKFLLAQKQTHMFPAVISFSPFLISKWLYYSFAMLSSAPFRAESCHETSRLLDQHTKT